MHLLLEARLRGRKGGDCVLDGVGAAYVHRYVLWRSRDVDQY